MIEKKAIVAIIQAMKIKKKPTKKTVNIAPKNNRVPAVSNMFSPDFCARLWKALRRLIAANR